MSIKHFKKDMFSYICVHIIKDLKDGFSEDEGKKREETVQQLTDKHIKKIDELLDAKEKEIMTV